MSEKVYCSECKYIKMDHGYGYIRCIYKDNLCDMKNIDWLYRDETIMSNNQPHDLNYFNNCKWYEEKRMNIRNELWLEKNYRAYPDKEIIKDLSKRVDKIDKIKQHYKYKLSLMTYNIRGK